MNLRDRIIIAYVGLLLLLLMLAAVSYSLTSSYNRTTAGNNLENALIISHATRIQAHLPKLTALGMKPRGSQSERAEFERKLVDISNSIATISSLLETTRRFSVPTGCGNIGRSMVALSEQQRSLKGGRREWPCSRAPSCQLRNPCG